MRYDNFEGANTLYTAPKGMEDRCGDLPVLVTTDDSGDQCCVSAWYPSPADIAAQQAGRPVLLKVVGGQPPVALFTLSETGEINP